MSMDVLIMSKWLNGRKQRLVLVITVVVLAGFMLGVNGENGGCVKPYYTAGGRVLTEEGEGIGNVVLSFEPDFGTATSVYGCGAWSKADLEGEVTISPAKPGWEFDPEEADVTESSPAVNFTATFVEPEVLAGDYVMTGQFWLSDEKEGVEPSVFQGQFTLHVGEGAGEVQLYKTALSGTIGDEELELEHEYLGTFEGPIVLELDPDLEASGSYNLDTWEFEMVTPLLITIPDLYPDEPFHAEASEEGVLNPAEGYYSDVEILWLDGPLEGTRSYISQSAQADDEILECEVCVEREIYRTGMSDLEQPFDLLVVPKNVLQDRRRRETRAACILSL